MKIEITSPKKKYPYLAVHNPDGDFLENALLKSEVFLISTYADQVWASAINGGCYPYKVLKESDFMPLPSGTVITITQE